MKIRNVVIGLIVSALVAGVVVSCGGGGGGGSPAPAAPPVASGTGRGAVVVDATTRDITGSFSFMGVSGTPTSAGIYVAPAGQNQVAANALIPLTINRTTAFVPAGTPALTTNQLTDLQAGNFYFLLKTSTFPNGEIRGQITNSANLTAGLASLDGTQAGTTSAATGAGVFVVNATTGAIIAGVTTYGGAFTSTVTLAHIHDSAQANAVRIDFTPVTQTFSTPTDPETGISATDLTSFTNGTLYYNVHTVNNGGGEIRGALVPTTTQTVRSASLDTTQVVP